MRFDTIHDFVSGSDKIDLSAVDADATRAGHQSFIWSGDGTPTVGELALTVGEDFAWRIIGETDGDAEADFMIHLSNDHDYGSFAFSDVILG